MSKRSAESDDESYHEDQPPRSRKRANNRRSTISDEEYNSNSNSTPSPTASGHTPLISTLSSKPFGGGLSSARQQRSTKLTNAFVKVLLGLENKHQILTKNFVTKIIEAENEKGQGVQFKKHLLPEIKIVLNHTFGLDLVELPISAAPVASDNSTSVSDQNRTDETRSAKQGKSSEEYILVSILPQMHKDAIFSYFNSSTSTATQKPESDLIKHGLRLLIISIILLNENHITKQDLLSILKSKFKLSFKETQPLSILHDSSLTLTDFLQTMVKQEYLNQIDNSKPNAAVPKKTGNSGAGSNGTSSDSVNHGRRLVAGGKNVEDQLLELSVGRRTLVELPKDSFLDFLQTVYPDWNDELEKSALYTLNSIWSGVSITASSNGVNDRDASASASNNGDDGDGDGDGNGDGDGDGNGNGDDNE